MNLTINKFSIKNDICVLHIFGFRRVQIYKMYIVYIMYIICYNNINIKQEVSSMEAVNVTNLRKDMGRFIDSVLREKPRLVKRTRDKVLVTSVESQKEILKTFTFTANSFKEDDDTITASLEEFDIVVNANNQEEAINLLANDLIEYAEEFYEEFNFWSSAPNRKVHFPYILNVLLQDDIEGVKALIKCQAGKI